MKRSLAAPTIAAVVAALLSAVLVRAAPPIGPFGLPFAAPISSAFTYQGQLAGPNGPLTASCDFQFQLFDAATGGNQIGGTLTQSGVAISGGLFTTVLDFGSAPFAGEARWLQSAVQCPGDAGFTVLTPRHALTATPYALYAASAGSAVTAQSALNATNALTATNAITATNALNATNAITAASATNALNATNATNAATATDAANATNALNATNAVSAQSAVSATTAINATNAQTATVALSASTATTATTALSANSAVTASNAPYGGLTGVPGPLTALASPPSCSNNNVPKWTGTTWACAADNDTSYSAGSGIAISGNNVISTTAAPRPRAASTVLDGAASDAGQYLSMAIGVDGLPIIAYYDATNTSLKVAHCETVECSTALLTSLDGASTDVGQHTAIVIGSDGMPLIAYRDVTNTNLKVAHCNDVKCTSATLSTVSNQNDTGYFPTFAITRDESTGQVAVMLAYSETTGSRLMIGICTDTPCSSFTFPNGTGTDFIGNVGQYAVATTHPSGSGQVFYYKANATSGNGDVRIWRCNNADCVGGNGTSADVTAVAEDVGTEIAVATMFNGNSLVLYRNVTNNQLEFVVCLDETCTGDPSTILTAGGRFPAVTILPTGHPLIVYADFTNDQVRGYFCLDFTCSSRTQLLDLARLPAATTAQIAVTVGSDGYPLIAFWDDTNRNLTVVHSRSPFGTVGVPRR